MRKYFILFIISILPYAAFADAVQIGSLWYNLDESAMTAEVTSSGGDGYSGDIEIPATVPYGDNNYSVTCIGSYAFSYSSISSVVIPEGVDSIASDAFRSCTSLTSVSFPTSTLRIIEHHSFYDCYSLTNIIIPEGVTRIGTWAFGYNNNNRVGTAKIELPSTLSIIEEYAFCGVRDLSTVVSHIVTPFEISASVFCSEYSWQGEYYVYSPSSALLIVPDGAKSAYQNYAGWKNLGGIFDEEPNVTTEGNLSYYYFTKGKEAMVVAGDYSDLQDIVIPQSIVVGDVTYPVKAIGSGAFKDCHYVSSFTFSEGLETIGNHAFYSCWNAKFSDLPVSLTSIGYYAFFNCNNLKKIVIPDKCTTIGRYAFESCSRLQSIDLSNSVDSIGEYAFINLGSLSAVISRIQNPFVINENVFGSNLSAILYVPVGKKSAYQNVSGWNVFADIIEGELKETTYNDLIYSYVEGNGTATVIGRANSELRDITVPAIVPVGDTNYAVKAIGAGAFFDISLNSVTIEDGVERIEKQAFYDSDGINELVLPSTLKIIGDEAFTWAFIKSLNLPEGLDSIGRNAFSNCNNLNKVVIPSTLAHIGESVFNSCGSIIAVVSKIQSPFAISESVFSSSTSATLYVPVGTKSVYQSTVGWNNFADIVEGELKETTYEGLNYIYVEGKGTATVVGRADSEMRKISIPATLPVGSVNYNVKAIGSGAFRQNNIDTLIISAGVETIEKNAFNYCNNLKKVELSSTLKTVGDYAFYDCNNIKRIELPSSLDSIGNQAFYSCDNLMIVVSKIQNPFKINTNVFVNNGSKSSAVLYVPEGTTSAYQKFEGWNVFSEIIEGEPKEITYEGLIYNYFENKGTATVIGRADETLRTIKIPGVVPVGNTNYFVKTIGNAAFYECYIDTLVVSEGVETIEKRAFKYNYYSLKSITLPTSLRTIGDEAFYNCYGFNQLIIPEGVDSIGIGAFRSCSGIQKLEIPSTVTRIGEQAFAYNGNLTSVTSRIRAPFAINQNVFCRDYYSNWDSEQQKDVYTYTKSNANLYVPEGTSAEYQKYDGWNMFAGMYEGEIKEYESDSLKYAYLMTNQTATVIASEKYRDYSAITIPGTVTIDGTVYQVKEVGASAFSNCGSLRNITINEGVENIGNYAFQDCYNADFGQLPSSLRTIGDFAFRWCSAIAQSTLPEGLLTIGKWAFGNCSNLQKVVLPSTLTSIDENAFRENSNLSTVISHISSPFEINKNVFGSENWISETQKYEYVCAADLYVPEGTIDQYKRAEGWNVFLNIYEGELKEIAYLGLAYTYNTSTKVATVVKGDNYSELKTVSIPATIPVEDTEYPVKTIGGRAFSSTSITSVEIADGIEIIAQEAFSGCEQLARLTLPSTLVTIGNSAFNNCRRLAGIKIPASVNTIGSNALSGCYNLESIEVADGNEVYESLGANVIIERKTKALLLGCKNSTIPDGVLSIEAQAFNNCQIAKVQFPTTVKSIGYNAFASCRYLTEVTLPEGLDSIANGAFRSCEKLEMVEFPKTTKYFGNEAFYGCYNLINVVSNIEDPREIQESVFGSGYSNVYSQATLWVPKGKIDAYKRVNGWNRFNSYDELLRDILEKPTITYNGRYLVMTNNPDQRAKIYYSTDGTEPTILYSDTVALSNLGTIQAISKRFGSYTVDTTRYEVTYVYDGVTARTASGGLLKNAFEWCGTDKIEMLDIDGQLNDDDFATIRGLSKLTILNMAASRMESSAIPSGAFANMKLEWYVSPYNFTSVGSGIFKGCDKLAALTWNSSTIEVPEDVVTDAANPNMLVYAKAQAMIPYAMRNVIVNGVANNIILVDSAGNNNFKCPEEFLARRITYTHDYQQKTELGQTQGWETLALPFTVSKIIHETKGELTPSAIEGAAHPFWLYELGGNGLEKATEIRANTPYLICMPNDDAYGDDYILGGRVTFSASNVKITTSDGTTVSNGDRQFVPTYQRVASSSDVYALNVGQVVGDNRIGSAFIPNLREVRPFEAYSVHSGSRTRSIPVSSLGGGDATGINDLMLKNGGESLDGVVKVYSLSGALIKQGKREEVLRSLPKGLYIIDGKKIIK